MFNAGALTAVEDGQHQRLPKHAGPGNISDVVRAHVGEQYHEPRHDRREQECEHDGVTAGALRRTVDR